MTTELEKLNTELQTLECQLAKIKTAKLQAEKEYKKTLDKVLEVRKYIDELNKVTDINLRVTDHAILRYVERFKGFDPEPIRQAILARINLEDLVKLGGTLIIKDDLMRIVIDNYTVITITEPK